LDPSQTQGNPLAIAYQYVANQLLNANRTAALTTILVDFDPMSRSAEQWLANTRTIVANFSQTYTDYEFYLYGGAVEVVDLVKVVSEEFPLQVAATCVILFLIMGLVFRSVLIPIRGLLTIGLSVAWTFGLAVLIFEKWLQTPLYWFTPIFSFSIVVGLGLDYDIFLLSRIHEYRDAGFGTNASIVKGTYLTGYIITGAGVIMILAFISLCITHVPMILQFSVILSSAVLLDTFVVRTALVPAIMRLCGWLNWWPSQFGSAQAEKSSGMYSENFFLNEELEEKEAGDRTAVYYVRPHHAKAFFARRRAIRDIIEDGLPDWYSYMCCKRAADTYTSIKDHSQFEATNRSIKDLSRSEASRRELSRADSKAKAKVFE
jgi:predicted RND superfamily exporter protein